MRQPEENSLMARLKKMVENLKDRVPEEVLAVLAEFAEKLEELEERVEELADEVEESAPVSGIEELREDLRDIRNKLADIEEALGRLGGEKPETLPEERALEERLWKELEREGMAAEAEVET